MRLVLVAFAIGLSACGSEPATDTLPAPPEADPVVLAEVLPDTLVGRARQALDQSRDQALGAEVERVEAGYGEIVLSITDFKTAEMTEMMGYGWALAPSAERLMGHPVSRTAFGDSATVHLVVGGRYLVETVASTEEDAMAALRALDLSSLD